MGQETSILVVDDDEVSVMAIDRALSRLGIANPVIRARDGIEALETMRTLMRPFIILLDINMPRMNGHEFLAEIRSDPRYKGHVVFILTTSDAPQDIEAAYDRQIAGYILKDNAFESIKSAMCLIRHYVDVVRLTA